MTGTESPSNAPSNAPHSTRATWLLFAGAMLGLGLAALGLLEERRKQATLPGSYAAVVGERTIRTVDYQRVLAGVESDLRNPIDDALRRRVLDRMIDEELLVQRALDLGLAVVDRRVRGELTSGLIDSIVSEADAVEAARISWLASGLTLSGTGASGRLRSPVSTPSNRPALALL